MANTATIRIQDIQFDWIPGEIYTFNIDKDFTREVGGNRLPSDTQTSIMSFTAPTTYGTFTGVNPTFNSSDIYWPKIALTYDRSVANVNTGSFYLYKVSSPSDVLVTTIAGTDTRVTTSLSTATLDLSANYELFEGGQQYYIISQPKAVTDIFNFPVETVDSSKVKFTYKTSPSLINVTPASTSTGVYLPQINLTYDRPMTELTTSSNFYLYRKDEGSDSLVLTMNNTNPRVVTSGTTATINLSLDYDLFDPLKYYYITSDIGVLRDPFLLPNPAITNTSTIAFTYVDNPKLQSVTPALGATNVVLPSIRLTYDKGLNKGVLGSINVYKAASNELVLSFPPTDSRFTATNTTTAIINLTNERTLFEGNTEYIVTVGNKSLRDEVTFLGTDAINTGTIGFRYKPNPNLLSISPTNGTSDVALPKVRLTYNEPVMKTSQGSFYLYKETTSSNVLVATIIGTDTRVTTVTSTATIDLSQNYGYFEGGQKYFLTTDPRTITDLYNLPTPQLSSSNASFTYRLNPVTTSTYPANNQQEILAPNIRIEINRIADVGTGTVYLYKYQDNTSTLALSIPTTDSRISTSGTNFFINLTTSTNIFESGRDYYLTNSVGAFRDDSRLPLLDLDRGKLNFVYYLDPFPGVAVLTSNISDFSSATSVTFTVTSSLSVTTGTISLSETYFEGGFYPDFFITQDLDSGFVGPTLPVATSTQSIKPNDLSNSTSTSITISVSAGQSPWLKVGTHVTLYSRSSPTSFIEGKIWEYSGNVIKLTGVNTYPTISGYTWDDLEATGSLIKSDWNVYAIGYAPHWKVYPEIRQNRQSTHYIDTSGFNKFDKNYKFDQVVQYFPSASAVYLWKLSNDSGGIDVSKNPLKYRDSNYAIDPLGIGDYYRWVHLMIKDPITGEVGYYQHTSNSGLPFTTTYDPSITGYTSSGTILMNTFNSGKSLLMVYAGGVDVLNNNKSKWENITWINSVKKLAGWYLPKMYQAPYPSGDRPTYTTGFPYDWDDAYGYYFNGTYQYGNPRPVNVTSTETFISNVLRIGQIDLSGLPPSTLTNVLLASTTVTNTSTVTFNVSTSSFVNKGTPSNLQGYHFFIAELSKNEINSHLYKGTTSTLVTLITK